MIREIVADRLERWAGESDPQCFVCRTPLAREEAVELDGEPSHRDCVQLWQAIGREATRRGGGHGV